MINNRPPPRINPYDEDAVGASLRRDNREAIGAAVGASYSGTSLATDIRNNRDSRDSRDRDMLPPRRETEQLSRDSEFPKFDRNEWNQTHEQPSAPRLNSTQDPDDPPFVLLPGTWQRQTRQLPPQQHVIGPWGEHVQLQDLRMLLPNCPSDFPDDLALIDDSVAGPILEALMDLTPEIRRASLNFGYAPKHGDKQGDKQDDKEFYGGQLYGEDIYGELAGIGELLFDSEGVSGSVNSKSGRYTSGLILDQTMRGMIPILLTIWLFGAFVLITDLELRHIYRALLLFIAANSVFFSAFHFLIRQRPRHVRRYFRLAFVSALIFAIAVIWDVIGLIRLAVTEPPGGCAPNFSASIPYGGVQFPCSTLLPFHIFHILTVVVLLGLTGLVLLSSYRYYRTSSAWPQSPLHAHAIHAVHADTPPGAMDTEAERIPLLPQRPMARRRLPQEVLVPIGPDGAPVQDIGLEDRHGRDIGSIGTASGGVVSDGSEIASEEVVDYESDDYSGPVPLPGRSAERRRISADERGRIEGTPRQL